MQTLSPLRACARAAGWIVSGTWNAVKFTANWISSPTKMAGTGLVGYTIKNSYDKSPLFLGSSGTTLKTDAFANFDPSNGPPGCPNVSGIFGALLYCPLPFKDGSYECWGRGWETSLLGRSSLGQAAEIVTKPLRIAAKTGYCFATEKGTMNSLVCAMGYDQAARNQAEEKTSLIGIFALLILAWYLSRPREDDENKKRV